MRKSLKISLKNILGSDITFDKQIKENVVVISFNENISGTLILTINNNDLVIQEVLICQ